MFQLDFVYELVGVAAGGLVTWTLSTSPASELGTDRAVVLVISAVAAARLATRVARSYWRRGPCGAHGEEFPPDR